MSELITIDVGHDIPIFPKQCTFCAHYFDSSQACEAFPNGIPEIISRGEFDHAKPYDGDNGILFEQFDEA